MSLLQRILTILREAEWQPGTLPDRGIMPVPFPVLYQHQTWDKRDPRLVNAPLARIPLRDVHATQRTVEAETIAKFLQQPDMGGPPVVTRTETGYAIVDGHHRLTAAKIRGEQTALVRIAESRMETPSFTVAQIADKHGVAIGQIEQQLAKGMRVEREHTKNDAIARKIALDHLAERPDYYDQLAKLEEDGEGVPAGVPANNAGSGNIAGLGVGPKGEPGIDLRKRKKKIAEGVEVRRIGIAPEARAEFWKIGDEVYRTPYRTQKDISGQPMGRRWECTYKHWLHYRKSAYGWVDDLKERLNEAPVDTFGAADVFDVDMERLLRVQTKKRWERYSKYLELDEVGEEIRQHARKNRKRDVILRDSKTGVMRFLRRRGHDR